MCHRHRSHQRPKRPLLGRAHQRAGFLHGAQGHGGREGAGEPPTIRVIKLVNTFWDEGGTATFLQSAFKSKKKSNSGL